MPRTKKEDFIQEATNDKEWLYLIGKSTTSSNAVGYAQFYSLSMFPYTHNSTLKKGTIIKK